MNHYGTTVHEHISSSQSELYRRTESYLVDGKRLGDIELSFRGNPHVDFRYTPRFAEIMTAAFTLSLLRLENVRLEQRERPDFQVHTEDGKSFFLEVSSVIGRASAHYSSLLDELNVALNKLIATDPAVSDALDGKFAEVLIPTTSPKELRSLLFNEIREVILDGDLSSKSPHLEKISDRYPTLNRLGAQLIRGRPTRFSHFAVRGPARAVGPYDLVNLTLQRLHRKREQARSYDGSPLWLVLYFGEPHAIYETNLQMLAETLPHEPIEPFDRVLIGDQRQMIDVRKT